jgi:hypothetical protein
MSITNRIVDLNNTLDKIYDKPSNVSESIEKLLDEIPDLAQFLPVEDIPSRFFEMVKLDIHLILIKYSIDNNNLDTP